jgi:SSS family solute:Na+ symporter
MNGVNGTALVVFVALFALVTVVGFVASRWRRGDLDQLHEWGLGGRRFGTCHVVLARRRPLHRVRSSRPGAHVRCGALGFFAVPKHDHHLSVRLRRDAALVERITFARVSPRPISYAGGSMAHRSPSPSPSPDSRDDAVHRASARRHQVVLAAMGLEDTAGWRTCRSSSPFVISPCTYRAASGAPALASQDAIIYVTVIAAVVIIPASSAAAERSSTSPPRSSFSPPPARDQS